MWSGGENHKHQQHFFIITIFPHHDICSDGQQHHIVINLSKLSSLQVYEAPPECVMSKENCLGIQVLFIQTILFRRFFSGFRLFYRTFVTPCCLYVPLHQKGNCVYSKSCKKQIGCKNAKKKCSAQFALLENCDLSGKKVQKEV